MRAEQFLKQLSKALADLPPLERARTLQYYREALADRMEDGCTEEEAVAGMEPVETIAHDLLQDAAARGALKPRRSGVVVALLVLGSPLWLVFAAAAVVVIVAMYAVVWAVIAALAAAVVALVLSAAVGVAALVANVSAFPLTGLFLLGCGLTCGGVGVLLAVPVWALIRSLARGTAAAARKLWHRVMVRKGEAL